MFRSREGLIALAGAVGLIVLAALRGVDGEVFEILRFALTMGLFFLPGFALTYLLLGRVDSLAFRTSLAFILSIGAFGVPALPALLSHWSLTVYLSACAVVLLLGFGLLTLLAIRSRATDREETPTDNEDGVRWWMWLPFVVVSGMLAIASATGNITYGHDVWAYLAYVRDFLAPGGLAYYDPFYGRVATFNRIHMNAWLLEQAAFSRVSGLDPVPMTLRLLPPLVMVCSVLASYFVAKAVLVKARPVLIASFLSLLIPLLPYLKAPTPDFFDNNAFIGITMDKQVIYAVFLPVALGLAVMFLRERRWRHLLLFALTCGTMMVVHPIGLVVLCFALVGMGVMYLLFGLRQHSAWLGLSLLALAPAAILLPVVGYILSTGTSPIELRGSIANYYYIDPSVIGYIAIVGDQASTLQLGNGLFMLDPAPLLDPIDGSLMVLTLLFLVWRVRSSFAARLLLGIVVFVLMLVYFPPLSTLVGTQVGPSQLARIYWSVGVVVPLTLGWMVSDLIGSLSDRVRSAGRARTSSLPVSGALTFVFAGGLTAFLLVFASPGIASHVGEADDPTSGTCLQPIYRWVGKAIDEPSVVLADDVENSCIPVYATEADVVSVRGDNLVRDRDALEELSSEAVEIPQYTLDAYEFGNSRNLDEDLLRLIRRNRADYVLVRKQPLKRDVERYIAQGGEIFSSTDSPGRKLELYKVNQQTLETYLEARDSR